jgi:hypothetical protein
MKEGGGNFGLLSIGIPLSFPFSGLIKALGIPP